MSAGCWTIFQNQEKDQGREDKNIKGEGSDRTTWGIRMVRENRRATRGLEKSTPSKKANELNIDDAEVEF